MSVHLQLPGGVSLDPGVEYRDRLFTNSFFYPDATGQDGHQLIGYVLGSGPLPMVSGLSWQGRLAITDATASYVPYAYDDVSIDFSLPYSFTAPVFAKTGRPWTFAPLIGYSHTPYREPDPIVNSAITRVDDQLRVGATLDMTFMQNLGVQIQVEYVDIQSTVTNYRTNDFIVSGGPTLRF